MAKIRVRWLFCIEIFQVYIAPFLVCCPSEIKFDRRFLPIANGNFSIDVRTGVALQGTKKLVHWTKILLLQNPKNRIISLAKASTHPLPKIFLRSYYLLTLQENKYLADI